MQTTTTNPNQMITSEEASEMLGLKPQTLALWRSANKTPQPKYVRVGTRAIRYRHRDLMAFIDAQTVGAAEQ